MSFILYVNFLKGWPAPAIKEKVAKPAAGVTILQGAVGRLDENDKWALGVDSITQEPFIWRNATGDSDANHEFVPGQDYQMVNWGGIQGISFDNPLLVQTARFGGTPAKGDLLYADTADGFLKVGKTAAGAVVAAGKVLIARCEKAPHQGTGQGPVEYITFSPLKVLTVA